MKEVEKIRKFIDENNGRLTINYKGTYYDASDGNIYETILEKNLPVIHRNENNDESFERRNDGTALTVKCDGIELFTVYEHLFHMDKDMFLRHVNDPHGEKSHPYNYFFWNTAHYGNEAYLTIQYLTAEQYKVAINM